MKLPVVLFFAGVFLLFFPTNVFAKLEVEKSSYHRTNSVPHVPWRTITVNANATAPKIHSITNLTRVVAQEQRRSEAARLVQAR